MVYYNSLIKGETVSKKGGYSGALIWLFSINNRFNIDYRYLQHLSLHKRAVLVKKI